MNFRTPITIDTNEILSLETGVVSLGSCFSESISQRIKNISASPSKVLVNPFGVLFNPNSIAGFLNNYEEGELSKSIIKKGEAYYSLLAHSSVFEKTKDELISKLLNQQQELISSLANSNILIITFGSAWYYYHQSTSLNVANCHKIPNKEFEKRMLSASEIIDSYQEIFERLKEINPELNVLITVSPVRHWKDGYRENTVSKANLHTAVHELCKASYCHYFPSYEIQMDELRDYRFYKEDMLHPSEQAIDFIWNKFKAACYSPSDNKRIQEIEKINRFAEHRPSNADEHKQKLEELKKKFISSYKINPWGN